MPCWSSKHHSCKLRNVRELQIKEKEEAEKALSELKQNLL